MSIKHRSTDGYCGIKFTLIRSCQFNFTDQIPDTFRNHPCFLLIVLSQNNQELISSISEYIIIGAHIVIEHLRYFSQKFITKQMPVRIIDKLEFININNYYRERLGCPVGVGYFTPEYCWKKTPA